MSINKIISNQSLDINHELINKCPVCQSENRSLLYQDLKDYRCVENNANSYCFFLCLNCNNGYYNPRPTIDSIHLLYRGYGTHSAVEVRREFESLGWLGRVKRKIANGYTNSRYKTTDR